MLRLNLVLTRTISSITTGINNWRTISSRTLELCKLAFLGYRDLKNDWKRILGVDPSQFEAVLMFIFNDLNLFVKWKDFSIQFEICSSVMCCPSLDATINDSKGNVLFMFMPRNVQQHSRYGR